MLESFLLIVMFENSMKRLGLARILCLVAVVVLICSVAAAQSGRRSSKALDKKEQAKPQRKVSLLVSVEDRDQFSNIPYYLADTALDNCIDRLRDASEISVSSSARGMSRPEAIRRAKAEKELYVVWLQIVSDIPEGAKQPKKGPDELYLRYTIFQPGDGKPMAEGRTHKGIYRTSGGGMSAPSSSRNNPIYSDYALKQAAREAADMIMRAFEITPPDEP
jgi:hypothetical protein